MYFFVCSLLTKARDDDIVEKDRLYLEVLPHIVLLVRNFLYHHLAIFFIYLLSKAFPFLDFQIF
jgi:hypothetical protein